MADALDSLLTNNNAFGTAPSSGSGFGGLSLGNLFSAFGGGMSATAAYTQAKNQQAALTAQAQVLDNNATVAGWQADDATAAGRFAAQQTMQKGAQVKGSQRAAMAANGVDLGGESAQRVLTDTDYISAMDSTTLQNNAERQAWGYRMQSKNLTDQASAARSGASNIKPWLAAGTSLLTTATTVASRWYSNSAARAGA